MTAGTSGPPGAGRSRRHPLIGRNYGLLWAGQAISVLGDFVFDTTLALWIAAVIARGQPWAPLAVGALAAAVSAPTILLGPIAGVFVDRMDKRRLMLAMDAARALLVSALLVAAAPGASVPLKLGLIYAVVAACTCCSQFFGPARLALIGDIVSPADRRRASALSQTTMSVALILGPPLAGPLLLGLGTSWALVVNALSFVVSFAAIWLVHARPAARSADSGRQPDIRREFLEGAQFLFGSRVLRVVFVSLVIALLGAGALNALDVFFVARNLHTSEGAYGILVGAMGAGLLVASFGSAGLIERVGAQRTFGLSVLAVGAGMLVYSRMTAFVPGLVALFLLGVVNGPCNTAIGPIILATVPREMIGRVTSFLSPAMAAASIVSSAVAAFLAGTVLRRLDARIAGIHFGPLDTIFMGTALLIMLAGAYATVMLWESGRGDQS